MSTMITLLSIASATAIGAISPGPSFVMIARTAVTSSRANGLAAAFGMGIGGTIFAVAVLLGLQALLASVPVLYLVLKAAGGAYLAYIGYRIWKGANSPLMLSAGAGEETHPTLRRSFLLGLAAQLSNPKTAICYGSIFASLLPKEVPVALMLALPLVIFTIEAGWYSIVATLLSSASPRDTYLRYKSWVDRVAGGVMGLLGVRLVATSAEV
ncbi:MULTISPECIES: LysE family translocator [unclassified Janthinobacterium]|uniref:LysE family translocator n=1 Tax=unclassified Janthinobacterium TaxID=2610881 RepID=UPI000475850C|nr:MULTISPECIES: LysE family translocator [unclassified Janthinobacterium]MEC5163942.1 threonine/homoserine/homoserine lactone efflux protein [Janthinobacterium sp. CG_S6]